MSILFILLDRWRGAKVGEKVERPTPPPRKQAFRRARKKTQQVGFGKTVEVDHEIKLTAAHVFDDLENSQHGKRLESVAQRDAIDGDGCVSAIGHLDYLGARLADGDG